MAGLQGAVGARPYFFLAVRFFLGAAFFLAVRFFLGAAFFLTVRFFLGAAFFLTTRFFLGAAFFLAVRFFLGAAFFFGAALFFGAAFFTVRFFTGLPLTAVFFLTSRFLVRLLMAINTSLNSVFGDGAGESAAAATVQILMESEITP